MVCLHSAVMYPKGMGRSDKNGTRVQFFHLCPLLQLDENLLYLCILLNILFLKELTGDIASKCDVTIVKYKFLKGE
jgi:hypothetical protein